MKLMKNAIIFARPLEEFHIMHSPTDEIIKVHSSYVVNANNKSNIESARGWAKSRQWEKEQLEYIEIPYSGETFHAQIISCVGRNQSGYTYKVICWIPKVIPETGDMYPVMIEMKSKEMMDILINSGVSKNGWINTKCVIGREGNGTFPIVISGQYYKKALADMEIQSSKKIKMSDLIVGHEYTNGKDEKWLYLGKMKMSYIMRNSWKYGKSYEYGDWTYPCNEIGHAFIQYWEHSGGYHTEYDPDFYKTKTLRVDNGLIDFDIDEYIAKTIKDRTGSDEPVNYKNFILERI